MKSVFPVCLLSVLAVPTFAVNASADSSRRDLHKNFKLDLNGDGKLDFIVFKTNDRNSKYQLSVNGATASGELLDTVAGFYIANIDRSDRFYEVVVYTPGPSDDDEHVVYWYNGKRLRRLAHLERWVNYRGDGTLRVTTWAGFWQPKDEWVLTSKHDLHKKARASYPVNIKAKTTKTTPLHLDVGGKTRGTVPARRSVLIVKSNLALTWYYVKAGNKSGWLSESELYDHLTGMPVAD